MIIDVHGTRKTETASSSRPYDFSNEEPRTRTPLTVSVVLGAVVAFVQSFIFTGRAHVNEPRYVPENDTGTGLDEETILAAEDEPADSPSGEEETGSEPPQSAGVPKLPRFNSDVPDSIFYPIEILPIDPDARARILWPANDWDGSFFFGFQQEANGVWKPLPGRPPAPPAGEEGELPRLLDEDEERDDDSTNRAPRVGGPVHLLDVSISATLVIMLSHLLDGAYDPDGDGLSVLDFTASSGALTPRGSSWIYEPEELGPITLAYTISDGEFMVGQTALFWVVKAVPIYGTDGDDMITGGIWADEIHGLDGGDIIDGREGDDIIDGGKGNDRIFGGKGNDILLGGPGHDVIFGGLGNDIIFGGPGNDRLFGEDGDDRIYGEDGDDYIDGGDGNDILDGGPGNDEIHGGPGNDTIFGGEGDDLLHGDEGDDHIDGGDGNDRIHGGDGDDFITDGRGADSVWAGAGNDHVLVTPDGEDDFFDGGEGCDTIDFSQATQGIRINLVTGEVCSVEVGNDTITGFEKIIGGQGDDHFIVGNAPVTLAGGEGDNTFEFLDQVPEAPSDPIFHKILDFKKGDVIKMSKYKIFDKVFDEFEDDFERIYGREIDDDDINVRYRYEQTEHEDRTIIEADLNNDNTFETSITLQGRHVLVIVEA